MSERRYPGAMEASTGLSSGANFSIDEETESVRRRLPRTKRPSLASEYSRVEREIEEEQRGNLDPEELEIADDIAVLEQIEIPEASTIEPDDSEEELVLTTIPEASQQRIHQSLMQELGKLEFPAPRGAWEESILECIEPQVHILIEAELRRMRAVLEERVNKDTLQDYAENIAAQIRPAIEEQIRQQMWLEFEEIMAQREAESTSKQ